MSIDFSEASPEDLRRLESQLKRWRIEREMGNALAREDFFEWARLATTWALDRVEDARHWLRSVLNLA